MNFWQTVPFARITLPFALGILMAEMGLDLIFAPGLIIGAVLLFGLSAMRWVPMRTQFNLKGVSLMFLLSSVGILQHHGSDERVQSSYFEDQPGHVLMVRVKLRPEIRQKNVRMDVEVVSIFDQDEWIGSSGNIKLYVKDSAGKNIRAGDFLQLHRSSVTPAPKALNPYSFDYGKYLHINNIHHTAFPDSAQWAAIGHHELNPVMSWIYQFQDYLLETYTRFFRYKNDRGIMEALTFGYKSELDAAAMEVYAKTGVIHVLAVSGLHVGLIYSCLQFITFFLAGTPFRRKIRAFIIVLGLIAYALLTGLSPSVNRAVLMFIMFVLADVSEKNNHSLNSLFSSAFILLIIQPLWLFHAGFQLSYLAVGGILLIHPRIEKALTIKNKWLKKVWTLISVSMAAQIATFPLCIYLFHQFPNLFLPANLIAIPATTVLLILGSILPITHWIDWLKPVSIFVSKTSEHILNFNSRALQWISDLPFALTENIYITAPESVLMYACIIAMVYFLVNRGSVSLFVSILAIFLIGFSQLSRLYENMHTSGWICFYHQGKGIPAWKDGRNLTLFGPDDKKTKDAFIPYFMAACGGQLKYQPFPSLDKKAVWKAHASGHGTIFLTRGLNKTKLKQVHTHSTLISITPIRLFEKPKCRIVAPSVYSEGYENDLYILGEKGYWKQLRMTN
jgi:competence protein ComEC